MQENKSAAAALQHHDGREKLLNDILQHLPGFVQWVTGLIGCTVFWSHGIFWLVHLEPFNAPAFAIGAMMVAVSAVMEVKHNEKV